MAKTIGNKTYPDNIEDILKNDDLAECVQDWAHDRQSLAENLIMFIQADKWSNELVYERFLQPGAVHTLDVRLQEKLVDMLNLAANDETWKHPIWKAARKSIREDCVSQFDKKYLPKFWDSAEFGEYRQQQAIKDMGSTSKVAKAIGISDDDNLRNLMIAASLGDKSDAEKHAKAISKKLKSKEDHSSVFARVKKAMGLR
jgi:hypothetical protein